MACSSNNKENVLQRNTSLRMLQRGTGLLRSIAGWVVSAAKSAVFELGRALKHSKSEHEPSALCCNKQLLVYCMLKKVIKYVAAVALLPDCRHAFVHINRKVLVAGQFVFFFFFLAQAHFSALLLLSKSYCAYQLVFVIFNFFFILCFASLSRKGHEYINGQSPAQTNIAPESAYMATKIKCLH